MNRHAPSLHQSKTMLVRRGSRALLALFAIAGNGLAAAQNVHPALTDRWSFQLGAYYPQADTTVRLNSTAGAFGTELSFEDDLGFSSSKTVPWFLGSVRLGERWKIEAEYLTLHRTSSRAINRTISWGDQVFAVNTVVSGEFDSDIYRLSGGYSFIKNNQAELGVVLGLHFTDFKASLGAAGVGAQTGDALAPLPTLGLYGAYAFTPKWLVSGRFDYFSLNYNEYDGQLASFNVGVDYRFSRHFGVGLGYRHVDYELNATKARFTGHVNYQMSGPVLYLSTSF